MHGKVKCVVESASAVVLVIEPWQSPYERFVVGGHVQVEAAVMEEAGEANKRAAREHYFGYNC